MLPEDWLIGTFVGRIETTAGPSPILVRRGIAFDMSAVAPTVSALLDRRNSTGAAGVELGTLDALNLRAPDERSDPTLLAPVDLQCIKAAGVTFRRLSDRAGHRGARPWRCGGRKGRP